MLACASLPFTHRPLGETLATIAGLGFAGWELAIRGDGVHLGHLDPADLLADPGVGEAVLAAQAAHPGLACVGAGFQVATLAPLTREIAQFTACCALLRRLRAPAVTIFVHDCGTAPLAERYRELMTIAVGHGLALRIETHLGTATADPVRALELCRELDPELTLDASHYVVQGLPWSAYAPLLPWVREVQVRACAPGRMELPAAEFRPELLIPPGFTGDVVVEYIARDVDWLATLLALRQRLEGRQAVAG